MQPSVQKYKRNVYACVSVCVCAFSTKRSTYKVNCVSYIAGERFENAS